jgi:hypothetical protein
MPEAGKDQLKSMMVDNLEFVRQVRSMMARRNSLNLAIDAMLGGARMLLKVPDHLDGYDAETGKFVVAKKDTEATNP